MKARQHTSSMLRWWWQAGITLADLAVRRCDGSMIWHHETPLALRAPHAGKPRLVQATVEIPVDQAVDETPPAAIAPLEPLLPGTLLCCAQHKRAYVKLRIMWSQWVECPLLPWFLPSHSVRGCT